MTDRIRQQRCPRCGHYHNGYCWSPPAQLGALNCGCEEDYPRCRPGKHVQANSTLPCLCGTFSGWQAGRDPGAKTHVLQAGDHYWRENRQGYTGNIIEAGLYTEAEARNIEHYLRHPVDRAIPLLDYREELLRLRRLLDEKLDALDVL